MRRVFLYLIAVSLAITGVAKAGDEPTPSLEINRDGLPMAVDGWENVRNGVFKDGRVFIAGQPDEAAFRKFHDLGVRVVVNLRPPAEMDNRDRVPFDEAALLEEIGLEYVQIPLGGEDHPYTPEAVNRFAEVMDTHPGPILLHCTVAWRASYVWAAYLILHQGYPLETALARGEAIAISPPPLEGLLGRDLTLTYNE